jgi:hypothetical protein
VKKSLLKALVLVLGVFCTAALFAPAPTFADDDEKPAVWLQISPVSQRLSLKPGDTGDYDFTVENIGSGEFTFKVYAAPYNVVGDNYDLNFTDETPRSQISRWITFDQDEYTLAPGDKQIVPYHIAVPEDVPGGGQYATIFAESGGKALDTNTSGVQTISRIGMILYARIAGETREAAEIVDYKIQNFYTSGNVAVSSKVKNSGNTDFEAQYSIKVTSFFGATAYEKSEVHEIFPDSERRVIMTWEHTPLFGIFHVTQTVSVPGSSRDETHLVLVIPPFMLIIALILLTFIIIWLIIFIKKRNVAKAKSRI